MQHIKAKTIKNIFSTSLRYCVAVILPAWCEPWKSCMFDSFGFSIVCQYVWVTCGMIQEEKYKRSVLKPPQTARFKTNKYKSWCNIWVISLAVSTRNVDLLYMHLFSKSARQSESVSISKWHAWFASRCSGRHLSTWQMIAASCLTAVGALYGQLTFRLELYHEHTAATGSRLWNSLPVQLRNPDITYRLFRQQLKGHLLGNHGHGTLWLRICSTSEKHLLTYLCVILPERSLLWFVLIPLTDGHSLAIHMSFNLLNV